MNRINIRERTWDRGGVRMLNYQLDYQDHNGHRVRQAVKGHTAVRADDHQGKLTLQAEAMRQAKQIGAALYKAHTTGDNRRSQATTKSVLQIVDEYLHPDYQREQTTKGKYMRRRLAQFKPSCKPLHAWTRQDSKDFMRERIMQQLELDGDFTAEGIEAVRRAMGKGFCLEALD